MRRFDLTYEELKRSRSSVRADRDIGFDLTYEELKRALPLSFRTIGYRVLILPMRN